jgi:UDP-3-O-[3-hydroxymyristoyl] glucosamine N-acyltransferase
MISLAEAARLVPLNVVRDGAFETVGNANYTTPRRLVFLESETWRESVVSQPQIACVITTPSLSDSLLSSHVAIATAEQPRRAFFELHNRLARETSLYWTDFPTEIHPTAQIHPRAFIAERNVRIGAGTLVEPDVTILERVIIGANCRIRCGVRLGTQGFEFKRIGDEILGVEHAGGVRLGDRVEIQANSAVDRSVFGGFTELGDDTKLDNQVHVAHNVKVGKRCLLAAAAMVAGSVIIEDDVWVGPASAISSSVTIGAGASITIGAVVTRNVPPGMRVSGNFAVEHDKLISFLRTIR